MGTYFLISGTFFLVVYLLLGKIMRRRKIQANFPKSKDYRREITYSMIASLILVMVPTLLLSTPFLQSYNAYHLVGTHCQSWIWLPVFYLVMLLLHDTYFYWTHRIMHHRLLFRWFHRVHHRSITPSPWTAYSFSPLEAIVQASIVPILVLIIPLPSWHIDIFFVFSLIFNAYGHLGYELFPQKYHQHWLGRWMNTAVHHDLHHQHGRNSYGLYLTLWDRMMGTMAKGYDQRYEAVTQPKPATPPIKPKVILRPAGIAA